MSIFDIFKPQPKLSRAEQQWNRMWEHWAKGDVPSPYLELMNYQSEVNNGGHSQYFCNTDNCGDLRSEVETLLLILPPPHGDNLRRACDAYTADDEHDGIFHECDGVFYANEEQINDILRAYADTLVL